MWGSGCPSRRPFESKGIAMHQLMTVNQILKVLKGRWRIVAISTAVVTLLALVVSVVMPKGYEAGASLMVDLRAPDLGLGADRRNALQPSTQTIMQTQVMLIRSERVARQVVLLTKLHESPQWVEEWMQATQGQGDLVAFVAGRLLKGLDVVPAKDASIIGIQYTAREPRFAATMANAFAQAYIDVNLDLKVDPARRTAGWFEEQRSLFAAQLALAQKKLADYQQAHGLLAVSEGQIDVENAKLASLTGQLADLQGQRAEALSRQQQAQKIDSSAEVQNNPLIAAIKADILRTEASVKQLSAQLGSEHPTLKAAQDQLAALKAQLNQERLNVARTVAGSSDMTERRLATVATELERQKQRVLSLKAGGDEVVVLRRDVERAQRALDAIETQQSQAMLESRLQQNNVSIVTTAVPPLTASKPRVALNTLVGILFGGLLGAVLALMQEMRRPLIRDAVDVAELLELPVLSTVSPIVVSARPSSNRPRFTLPALRLGRG